MPPRRSRGESKQGLVITLVLFILMTIGLGVATYLGFAEQAKLQAEAKKANDDTEYFKKERDWYKYQAWLYCKLMGHDQGIDQQQLVLWKEQFDTDKLAPNKVTDVEAVKKV